MKFSNTPQKPQRIFGSKEWKKGLIKGEVGQSFNKYRKEGEARKPKHGVFFRLFVSNRKPKKQNATKGLEDLNLFDSKGYMREDIAKLKVMKKDKGGKVPGYEPWKGYRTPKKRLEAFEPFRGKYGLTRKSVKNILTNLYKERRDLIRSGESPYSEKVKKRTKQLEYLKRITGEKPRNY
jgi:hypothetical protein